MEGRGKGIALMKEAMENHGLRAPELRLSADLRFEVILRSPGDSLDSIKVSSGRKVWVIGDATKAFLNQRQRQIISHAQADEVVTSGWCQKVFSISRETANQDLRELVEWNILTVYGKGPATRYRLYSQSSGDRQANSDGSSG